MISRPEVLLLDEPFNQVDATYREGLQHDIRYIVKEWGVTVVLVRTADVAMSFDQRAAAAKVGRAAAKPPARKSAGSKLPGKRSPGSAAPVKPVKAKTLSFAQRRAQRTPTTHKLRKEAPRRPPKR